MFTTPIYNILISSLPEGTSDNIKIAIYIAFVIFCIAVPYILGSLNFAVIISKVFYHDDIRKYGSGNAGATNMLRTYGKGAAIATMALDMLKCVLSVFLGKLLLGMSLYTSEEGTLICLFDAGFLCGLACILGHIFPCFYKFKGGKGVSTAAMVMLCNNWVVFLIMLVIFVLIVVGTKYVSLASVMDILLYPVILNALGYEYGGAKGFPVMMAFIMTVLIVFMHRENIKRIYNGTESKISFSIKKKGGDGADDKK